ncbi:MAG: glycoside hydrolase family 16 protein [Bacteroidota bacterium]
MKQSKVYIGIAVAIILISYLIFSTTSTAQINNSNTEASPQATEFSKLVWSDEFEGSGPLNPEKWFHQTQLPPGGSWWGGLIQHYTNKEDNSYQKDGYLHLVAKKEEYRDQGVTKQYTAARLNSKFAFTYGKLEVKAKLPVGRGTWPAIWMLNTNIDEDGAYWDNEGYGKVKWPNCGEIDLLEHWGKNQDYVSSAVHNGSSYGYKVKNVGGQKIKNASDEFHIYILDWTEEEMIFSVDGKEHFRYNPRKKNAKTWPYDADYYIILNIAIEPDIDPGFIESPMVVDYIRVYQ